MSLAQALSQPIGVPLRGGARQAGTEAQLIELGLHGRSVRAFRSRRDRRGPNARRQRCGHLR